MSKSLCLLLTSSAASYLDAVQAKVEAICRYQEEARQEIEAMTGAVLERVFRGEL